MSLTIILYCSVALLTSCGEKAISATRKDKTFNLLKDPESIIAHIVRKSPLYDDLSKLNALEEQILVGARACARAYSVNLHTWSAFGPTAPCQVDKDLPEYIEKSVHGDNIESYLKANNFSCEGIANRTRCVNAFSFVQAALLPNADHKETLVTMVCFRQSSDQKWDDLIAKLIIFAEPTELTK